MESTMMTGAPARAAQGAAAAARGRYEAPSLRVVATARVFAAGEYVYSVDAADNTDEGLTGNSLFGSGS